MRVSYDQARTKALARLKAARDAGLVDAKVEPLLAALNRRPDYFTTSSCAGRVQLVSVAGPGDKASSQRWGIWHDPPSPAQVEEGLAEWQAALARSVHPQAAGSRRPPEPGPPEPDPPGPGAEAKAPTSDSLLYLQAQSPIVHVACRGLAAALRLRALAVNSGWKYSSLRGLRGAAPIEEEKVMTELLSAERLDCPLARGPHQYIEGEALAFVLEVANATLARAQARLPRLVAALEGL